MCSPGARADDKVLVAIGRLVDKSLLVAEHANGAARYHQLETVRAYGRDRLAEAGETPAARDRHLGYFLGLVESASPLLDADADRWRLQLAPERDNLLDALDWGLAAEDPERGRRLAAGMPGCGTSVATAARASPTCTEPSNGTAGGARCSKQCSWPVSPSSRTRRTRPRGSNARRTGRTWRLSTTTAG